MLIKNFVKKYQKASEDEKKELMAKVITRTYVPVTEKQAVLTTMILNNAVRQSSHGMNYLDSVMLDVDLSVAVILLYTSLQFEKKEDDAILFMPQYDLLIESGVLDDIKNVIPQKELNRLITILEHLVKNYEKQEESIYEMLFNFVEIGSEILSEILDPILSGVQNIEEN